MQIVSYFKTKVLFLHKKMKISVAAFCLGLFLNSFLSITGQEKIELPAPQPHEQIIHHEYYTLSYIEAYELASWVAYELTKEEAQSVLEYKEKYREDPDIRTGSATVKDYKKAGYVMGQLAPAEHMMMSDNALQESFYLSNIVPHKLSFNKYVWKTLGSLIKAWAYECGSLYVVTGPVLTDTPFPTFGPSKVAIPERYYSVVLDPADDRGIGFVIRNSMSSDKLKQFAVSIDEVEEITGLDFFPALPDEREEKIESSFEPEKWNFDILEQ
jgi:endonuclease G